MSAGDLAPSVLAEAGGRFADILFELELDAEDWAVHEAMPSILAAIGRAQRRPVQRRRSHARKGS